MQSLRRGMPLAVTVTAATAMVALYLSFTAELDMLAFARALSFAPVGLASYRRRDPGPGVVMALLFGSAFVWQAAWAAAAQEPGADLPGAITTTALLFAVVPLMGGVAGLFRERDELIDTARERAVLLDRMPSVHNVAAFVGEEARQDLGAAEAVLILRDPLEDRWEQVKATGVAPVTGGGEGGIAFALWLVEQAEDVVIDDLSSDGRILRAGETRSVLAHPLRDSLGTLIAILVLTHPQPGAFGPDDFVRLRPLAEAAETALQHALAYAQAGKAQLRLQEQLSALHRMARELNAVLDPPRIARLAARYAREITGGEAAGASVSLPGYEEYRVYLGAGKREPADLLARGAELHQAVVEAGRGGEPSLLPNWRERLLAPIRRGAETAGTLVVETRRAGGFRNEDRQALASLAEHAAVALENARLLREASREREKTNQIIQGMHDGLVWFDGGGRVLGMNPAAAAITGHEPHAAAGIMICELLQCRKRAGCQSDCGLLDAIRKGLPFQDLRWALEEGARRVLALSASPLPPLHLEPLWASVLIRDVTEQDASARFQRELLATFSHELRGPLANITALAEVVLDDAEGGATVSRELMEMLRMQAQRLATLAGRTLDAARLDEGAWQLQAAPVSLTELARNAVARWRGAAPEREFVLSLPEAEMWAVGDEDAIGLILDNLIDNALKYGPPGMPITLVVVSQTPERALLAVDDRGEVIAPTERARLFQRFYRQERTEARKTYGFGLGLYIVKQLATAMGGDAWVEPLGDHGNRFALSLPLRKETG